MNPTLSLEEILALVDAIDPKKYAKTRNHLRGAVTHLSPYITRGVISVTTIRDRVLAQYSPLDAEKLLQELAWREYFQKVFAAKGKAIFSDLRFHRTDWKHEELVSAVVEGHTGITAIDAEIKRLLETGYMHNHARMWTAMLSCNVAKAHWYSMSRWMYFHLLDGDLASNTLSWQWVAGTSVAQPYMANQALINACSDTSDSGTYLDTDKTLLGHGAIAEELIAHEPFSYQTHYPVSDELPPVSDATVFLYHPWSLDPLWHQGEPGVRILVLEPRLFDAYPVSELVLEHLTTLAKTHVPNIQLYVGNVETIPGLKTARIIYSKAHPATTYFPGIRESTDELFPSVTGYYPSFFTFWQACIASQKNHST